MSHLISSFCSYQSCDSKILKDFFYHVDDVSYAREVKFFDERLKIFDRICVWYIEMRVIFFQIVLGENEFMEIQLHKSYKDDDDDE